MGAGVGRGAFSCQKSQAWTSGGGRSLERRVVRICLPREGVEVVVGVTVSGVGEGVSEIAGSGFGGAMVVGWYVVCEW